MSALHAPPPPFAPALPDLAAQIEGMMHDLLRTRDAVVGQIDAQIARTTGLLRCIQESAVTQILPPAPPAQNVMQSPPKLTSVVLASPEQPGLDPMLEQATLAELNQALSLAFTEIANRGGMLMK